MAVSGVIGVFIMRPWEAWMNTHATHHAASQERWLYWCPTSLNLPAEALPVRQAGSAQAWLRRISSCYYVNREGVVVAEAPWLEGKLMAKLFDERAGEEKRRNQRGVKTIEESILAFVSRFYEFGQFVVKNDDTLEIGWPDKMQIKVSLQDNPEEVAANLALILEKEIGERRDEVEYIDLRFGNRVYLKKGDAF